MTPKQQNVLTRLIEHCDNKNLYIDFYGGVAEPGYDDKPMLAADWNPPAMKRIGDFIERYFDDEIAVEWSDEWSRCDDCGKAVRTSPDSYGWQGYYVMGDSYLVCGDCVKENAEEYVREFINDTQRAIPSWFIEPVKAIGFRCPGEDCARFETGWHRGQNDTPEKALKALHDEVGKEWFERSFDYIFAITDVGQFDVNWTVLIRDKNADED